MRLCADHDRDGRRAEEPIRLHVPPNLREHRVTSRGERREIRDGRARGKRAPGFRRQAQDVKEPRKRNFLERRRRWGDVVEPCVLVPRRGEPIRGQRRGKRAADNEPEKPRPRHRHRRRRTDVIEFLDDRFRVDRFALKRYMPRREPFDGSSARCDVALFQRVEVPRRALRGHGQQLFHVETSSNRSPSSRNSFIAGGSTARLTIKYR